MSAKSLLSQLISCTLKKAESKYPSAVPYACEETVPQPSVADIAWQQVTEVSSSFTGIYASENQGFKGSSEVKGAHGQASTQPKDIVRGENWLSHVVL